METSDTVWLELCRDERAIIHFYEPEWYQDEWQGFPGENEYIEVSVLQAEQMFGIELNTDPARIGVLIKLDPRSCVVQEVYPLRRRQDLEAEDISGMTEDDDGEE